MRPAGALLLCLGLLASPETAEFGRADEPPAPVARVEHVVLLIVDSLPGEYMETLLHQGALPNIKHHLYDRGVSVRNAVTTYPSTSFAAHGAIMTGVLTNRHEISGLRWFDRETVRHQSYAGIEGLGLDDDLPPEVRVVYEFLPEDPTVAVGVPLHRGASEVVPGFLPSDRMRMGALQDHYTAESAPRFGATWLTSVDMATHRYGPYTDGSINRILDLDRYVGRFMENLRDIGIYDKTLVMVTADHGQQESRHDFNWRSDMEALGFDPYDSFLFNMRVEFTGGYNCVFWQFAVASGQLWLAEGGIPEGFSPFAVPEWSGRPTLSELRDYNMLGRQVDFVDYFTPHPSVEWIALRDDTIPGGIRLFSHAGEALLRVDCSDPATGSLTAASYAYEVTEGLDPLGLSAYESVEPLVGSGFHPAEEWFAATAGTDLPDAPVEIAQIVFTERSGDVFLAASDYWELHDSWHLGRHGGYTREEMVVPLLFAGPGIEQMYLDRGRTVDIVPTALDALGVAFEAGTFDGQVLPLWE